MDCVYNKPHATIVSWNSFNSLHDLYLRGKTKQKNVDSGSPSRILVSDPNAWMVQNTLLAQRCSATVNDLDFPHEIGMMTNFEQVHKFCMNRFFLLLSCALVIQNQALKELQGVEFGCVFSVTECCVL
jgi:hypothetical protein